MIHSILITGGGEDSRWQKAHQLAQDFLKTTPDGHPDFLLLEGETSLQISQVRELQKKLQLKPYAAGVKVALLPEAQSLTLPAQHSLLKTLEEPPEHSIIILTASSKTSLLPTIVSRCQVIRVGEEGSGKDQLSQEENQLAGLKEILVFLPGERLVVAEERARTRSEAINFCQTQITSWRQASRQPGLLEGISVAEIAAALRQSQHSWQMLKANINPQLVLGNLLLSYPKTAKM